MASFYAELHVAGRVYPLRSCTYAFTQATAERGRVAAKVRHGLVETTLDVPDDDVLPDWVSTPHKPLAGHIVFFETKGGAARETLAWAAGQGVGYREEFLSGSTGMGAYVCHLTIAAPKLTLTPGGPATAFVAPAARDHGGPGVVVAAGSAAIQAVATPLAPGSSEHKLVRWQEYQTAGKKWSYARWSKQYDVNMRNAIAGIGREKEYQEAFGGESRILKTAFTNRQIDLLRPAGMYAGQLKTGKVSLNKQARIDLTKDKWLVEEGYQVDYILEKGASQPFLKALDLIGATYQIGPQLP